jgi:hypothetical protein
LEFEKKTLESFINGPTPEQVEDTLKVQFEQDKDDDSSSETIKKHLDKIKVFVDDYLQKDIKDAKVTNTIDTRQLKFDKNINEIKGILIADSTIDSGIDFTGDDNFSFAKERYDFRMSVASGQIIMNPYFEKNTEITMPIDDSNYATTANGKGVTDEQRKAEIVEMKRDKTQDYKNELLETKEDIKDLNYTTCSEIKTQAYSGGYREDWARNYALTWAMSFNEKEYATQGNDCANFTSQALRAGGIKFIGTKNVAANWFYNSKTNVSSSWKGAHDQYSHFGQSSRSSRARYVMNTNNKNKIKDFVRDTGWGDIIHFNWDGNGMDHSVIVTDYEWSPEYQIDMPMVSGHTNPIKSKRLDKTGYWAKANVDIYFTRPSND